VCVNTTLQPAEKKCIEAMEDFMSKVWPQSKPYKNMTLTARLECNHTWTALITCEGWLKDEILDWRMSALQSHYWPPNEMLPEPNAPKQFFLFCSVFWSKKLYNNQTYRYNKDMMRWRHTPYARPYNIHSGFRLVLIPYNTGSSHWVLYVIDFHRCRIDLYDSLCRSYGVMNSSNHDRHERYRYCTDDTFRFMHVLAVFVDDEWKIQQAATGCTHPQPFDFADWYFHVHTDTPQQQGGNNCGVHVLFNAQYIASEAYVDMIEQSQLISNVITTPTNSVSNNTLLNQIKIPFISLPHHTKPVHKSQLQHCVFPRQRFPEHRLPQWIPEQWLAARKRIAIETIANIVYPIPPEYDSVKQGGYRYSSSAQ
jgi:Ulp1 protease family, C-terminal catalytic domain